MKTDPIAALRELRDRITINHSCGVADTVALLNILIGEDASAAPEEAVLTDPLADTAPLAIDELPPADAPEHMNVPPVSDEMGAEHDAPPPSEMELPAAPVDHDAGSSE